MLFPILGTSSLPVVVAKFDERHANRTASVLEWYDNIVSDLGAKLDLIDLQHIATR